MVRILAILLVILTIFEAGLRPFDVARDLSMGYLDNFRGGFDVARDLRASKTSNQTTKELTHVHFHASHFALADFLASFLLCVLRLLYFYII